MPRLGGALELYAVEPATANVLPSPVHVLPPQFGSLVLFCVQPGVSYHAVQEVASNEARLSISGWFHAAIPPKGADSIATLAQLERGVEATNCLESIALTTPRIRKALTSKQEARLASVVHPAYLMASTIIAVRKQLEGNGAALLSNFLRPEVAAVLTRTTNVADRRDGLAEGSMPHDGPQYRAGLRRKCWALIGPPQLQRYLRYSRAEKGIGVANGMEELAGDSEGSSIDAQSPRGPGAQLDALREVMTSGPFLQLMSIITGLMPSACTSQVRRFRPGMDYTLAHVGTQCQSVTLDATLSFVASSQEHQMLWESGDVGGFECHVSASNDHGAAEVYRADETSAGVTSIHAQANALSLVRRDMETMKFIKYVSAMAPGSRWDVAVEYTCQG